jgi:predicted RNA-binding protein associated with RNAse of E/G family
MTPQLVDVVDTQTWERSYSSGSIRRLSTCKVEPWGLRMECPTNGDPHVDAEVTWLLPDAGVRLTYQRPRSRHGRPAPSTLTAVRMRGDSRSWRTTDLLLGLEVPGNSTARIVCSAEFAAAVSAQIIAARDASWALEIVHRTLEELSRFGHNLGTWLAYHGVSGVWPPTAAPASAAS